MRHALLSLSLLCLVSASASAQVTNQPASATKPAATEEDVLKAGREDLQRSRADVMAKNLTLTAEQAAKFWPAFEAYQKEQNAIIDEHLKRIQAYADSYKTLDDAAALAFINAHFDRDEKMDALRRKWLAEFQKVVPTRVAVRAIQIDRRLSMLAQAALSSQIPLVY